MYVVTLAPRCSDAEDYMEDIEVLIIKGDTKSSAIKQTR